jgi:hypothetical protein
LWNRFTLLYGLIEKVGEVSIQVLNFATLLTGLKAPRRITKFVLNLLGVVTTNAVIIYAIFMNTQEMVILSALETLDITVKKHLLLKTENRKYLSFCCIWHKTQSFIFFKQGMWKLLCLLEGKMQYVIHTEK